MSPYSEAEIRDLLKREEGQYLEFKSLWDKTPGSQRPVDRRVVRDTIAEYVAAFANADGGTLVLGVDDDGTPSGHAYPEDAVADFLSTPRARLRPAVDVRTQLVSIDGSSLILFVVNQAAAAIMVDGNGFPYRAGDQVVMESDQAINARKQSYRMVGYEQIVRPEATLADLDMKLASQTLLKTVRGSRSVEEALEAYALINRSADGPRITNAALLLFGRPPIARWHPHADIRFFRVEGVERRHGTRRNVSQLDRLEGPLARLLPEAHRFAGAQIRKSERLYNLFFREIPEYPELAWQEALVNAVAHRDYAIQGLGIEVSFYSDRMEIASPGTLVPPVTLDGLRKRLPQHASRNPLIARVLVEAGYMRLEGEGIPRMFEEAEAVLLKAPALAEESGSFKVTLFNTPVYDGVGPEWRDYIDRLPLSPTQQRALLLKPEGFTNQDYRELNSGIDRDQAYREIQAMVEQGYLLAPGKPGRGAQYHLAPGVVQAKAWLEKRVPKLREWFTSHDEMKNTDYRLTFGVSRSRATDELRRLVEDAYLERIGERKASRYRPGGRL